MREQPIFQPDNMDIGEFQPLATVHGDEREGSLDFFFFGKFAVERDLFEEFLQRLHGGMGEGMTPKSLQERADIGDALIGRFGGFLGSLDEAVEALLFQKFVEPVIQRETDRACGEFIARAEDELMEIGNRGLGPVDEPLLKFHVAHDAVDRFALSVADPQKPLHGDIRETARRRIGDSQQAHIVVRVDERLEVCQKILNLAAVEKALSADQVVFNPLPAKRCLDGTRLLIGAEEDRLFFPGDVPGHSGQLDKFHDALGLGFIGFISRELDLFAITKI